MTNLHEVKNTKIVEFPYKTNEVSYVLDLELEDVFSKLTQSEINEINFISKMQNENEFGFIYFLKNIDTGLTKIGYSKDIFSRISAIKRTIRNYIGVNPKLEIDHMIFTHSSMLKILEKEIHDELEQCRKYGEWFELSDSNYYESLSYGDCHEIVGDTIVSITDVCESDLLDKIDYRNISHKRIGSGINSTDIGIKLKRVLEDDIIIGINNTVHSEYMDLEEFKSHMFNKNKYSEQIVKLEKLLS